MKPSIFVILLLASACGTSEGSKVGASDVEPQAVVGTTTTAENTVQGNSEPTVATEQDNPNTVSATPCPTPMTTPAPVPTPSATPVVTQDTNTPATVQDANVAQAPVVDSNTTDSNSVASNANQPAKNYDYFSGDIYILTPAPAAAGSECLQLTAHPFNVGTKTDGTYTVGGNSILYPATSTDHLSISWTVDGVQNVVHPSGDGTSTFADGVVCPFTMDKAVFR